LKSSVKASKKLSWLILFLFSTSAFATHGHIYLGGTLSDSAATIGNGNPTIQYDDGNSTDAYPIHGRHANKVIIGVNGGYEFVGAGPMPVIALGLGIYGTPTDYDYKGQLIATTVGDPSSTLYNYKYHVNSTRLMFEAQFTWLLEKLAPFINVGLGPAWNRLSGYTESPVDSTGYVALPPFQSRINTNFAYQVGFGVGYAFNFRRSVSGSPDRISLGYRYVNLGNTSLGTRGAVYPYNLDTGRLTHNEVYLSYTHLF
jgi:hypothetical protein